MFPRLQVRGNRVKLEGRAGMETKAPGWGAIHRSCQEGTDLGTSESPRLWEALLLPRPVHHLIQDQSRCYPPQEENTGRDSGAAHPAPKAGSEAQLDRFKLQRWLLSSWHSTGNLHHHPFRTPRP